MDGQILKELKLSGKTAHIPVAFNVRQVMRKLINTQRRGCELPQKANDPNTLDSLFSDILKQGEVCF